MKAATFDKLFQRCVLPISIHAAREGGDVLAIDKLGFAVISIHAAREGGDVACKYGFIPDLGFQSTPPVKAATPEAAFQIG